MSSKVDDNESEDDGADWEEVEENDVMKNQKEIHVEMPDNLKKKQIKKHDCITTMIRRLVNKTKKNIQINLHKVHLLCQLANLRSINEFCNEEVLQGIILSFLPKKIILLKIKSKDDIEKIINVFKEKVEFKEKDLEDTCKMTKRSILAKLLLKEKYNVQSCIDLAIIFTLLMRSLGLKTRLVASFQPISFKVSTVKENNKKIKQDVPKVVADIKIPQLDGAVDDDRLLRRSKRNQKTRNEVKRDKKEEAASTKKVQKDEEVKKGTKRSKKVKNEANIETPLKKIKREPLSDDEDFKSDKNEMKNKKRKVVEIERLENKKIKTEEMSDDEDVGSDYEVEKEIKSSKTRIKKVAKRRVKKEKSSSSKPKEAKMNYWIEIFIPERREWVCLDCVRFKVDSLFKIEKFATKPLSYVIAIDNQGHMKDITARYADGWMTTTRKLRITALDYDWWKETMEIFENPNQDEEKEEDEQIENILLSKPLPSSKGSFKDHPLYVLRRHLLKYEGIYPADVKPIGYIKSEEILPRSSVYTLHTRDKWLQEALTVKDGEVPYKMVASYLLNKKLNNNSDEKSLALFGQWQCKPYEPPIAKNGIVPRNNFGNVDLFKPCMLPIGCSHLRLANLNAVGRKLNIDVAAAIVGFDTHNCFPHPVTDGFVVCTEHVETLKAAWRENQIYAAEKAKKKLEEKIYSNWKKLLRGLFARERVQKRYGQCDEKNVRTVENWQTQELNKAKKAETKKGPRGRKKKEKATNNLPFVVENLDE